VTISTQKLTLDQRIQLAADNTLTNFYRSSGVPYFTYHEGEPPGTIVPDRLDLDSADVDLACRHIELLSFIQAAYPDARKHKDVLEGLLAWFRRLTNPDDGMLWANDSYDPHKSSLHTFGIDIEPLGRCISLHAERETLLALLGLMALPEHREEALRLFEKHVEFWDQRLHTSANGRFAPHIFYRASGVFSGHWLYPLSEEEQLFSMGPGRMIMPLVRFYDLTGNQKSLDIAHGLARYLLHESGDFVLQENSGEVGDESQVHSNIPLNPPAVDRCAKGDFDAATATYPPPVVAAGMGATGRVARYTFDRFGIGAYHNHSNIMSIAGTLLAADRSNDPDLYARAKVVFDEALLPLCSPFGWTPEMLDRAAENHPHALLDSIRSLHGCETCCVANMIETAIILAQTGCSDYWALAERFAKNHLFASQMTNADWVTDPQQRKMVLGSFSGRSDPNEFFTGGSVARCTMSCCHAEGTRALLLLRENVITESDGELSVNLGFSATEAPLSLEVQRENGALSYALTPSTAKAIRIRVPAGAIPDAAVGEIRAPKWETLAAPEAGKPCKFSWPLMKAKTQWTMPDSTTAYTTTWEGDQVVAIEPPGTRFPLYEGD